MDYTLEDLIDIPLFQKLQDKLSAVYLFPSAIIDNHGRVLTATAWQDVCTKFHRVHPECELQCRASDQFIRDHLHEANPAVTYRCPHGLVDNAIPIVIGGKHLGNYFTGQFFLEPPDLEFFRDQARRYGFDEAEYLDAVRRVPVWSQEKLHQYLDFMKGFTDILAGIGYNHLQEVEARHLVEQKDRELEETHILSRQILDSVEEGVVVYGPDLRYVLWNPFMERLSGLSAGDVLGRLPTEVFPFLEPAGVIESVRRALRGEVPAPIDFPFGTTADGSAGWASDTTAPLYGREGRIIGAIATIRDITERKRAEAALLTMQKLESLGTLAGGIAHDFNNVLTGILGNLSLLIDRVGESSDLGELVRETMDASMTARGLARQLLTFATGGQPVVSVVDLRLVMRDAITFAARGSSACVAFDLGPDPIAVRLDREQISQVFQNLTLNAVQAMPAGGRIHVGAAVCDADREAVPGLPAGPYVRVVFRDEGSGIPKALLARVFDPFFSTKSTGRGLGLAVCHSIVTKHGGHIGVESRPGEGSTFTIYLPAADPAELPSSVVSGSLATGTGTVLIMDDEVAVSRVLGRILERLGYRAVAVTDGAQAIKAYLESRQAGTPFDLVVMDLTVVGGMGGLEAVVQLRAIDPAVRAVVSSGYSTDPVMSTWAQHGFSGVIGKPYRLEDVATVMQQVLGQRG